VNSRGEQKEEKNLMSTGRRQEKFDVAVVSGKKQERTINEEINQLQKKSLVALK